MATKQMPTKPGPDESYAPPAGKGPVKGHRPPTRARSASAKLKPRADAARPPAVPPAGALGEQRAKRASRAVERYARLRVRVDDSGMRVVDSHVVDGPLTPAALLQGAFAYEVVLGNQLLHAGSIPDLGVMRSFAHPGGTPEQRGHHTYELKAYSFDARVPLAGLTRAMLSKAAVVLYRVKERAHGDAAEVPLRETVPLGAQRERQLREVGRVTGLPAAVLAARK